MHQTVLLCLSLLLVVSLLTLLGQRLRLPLPIFLVLSGLLISFVPGLPRIEVNPDLIFLIFLPPLLYEAAWFTSWREFWRWRRIIGSLAFGLVFFTAFAVAYFAKALIPGFTLALGFLLGGIVSPPDAVAATTVLRGIRVPRRVLSVLEGESLVNDAASLIVFRFALGAVLSGTFAFGQAVGNFFLVTFGGIAVGLAGAGVFYVIHRFVPAPVRTTILLTLLTPYLLYLTAEGLHLSGVMAVVSGGLLMANHRHSILNHTARLQGGAVWSTLAFALNGIVFILIGLELPVILRGLGDYSAGQALTYALLITLLLIATRLGAAYFMALFTWVVGRVFPRAVAERNPGWRAPAIVGWAGMRGVVSLASALSVPLVLPSGAPFPHRNLILFITFVVILGTLVVQGLTLPWVVRRVHFEDPDHRLPEDEQQSVLRLRLLDVALTHLSERHGPETGHNELVNNLKNRLETDRHLTNQHLSSLACDDKKLDRYHEIRTDMLAVMRRELREFQHRDEFDDDVIRQEEARLDLEEERVDHPGH
jgi:CPA1 family monovalent cation:H+ antiporter